MLYMAKLGMFHVIIYLTDIKNRPAISEKREKVISREHRAVSLR